MFLHFWKPLKISENEQMFESVDDVWAQTHGDVDSFNLVRGYCSKVAWVHLWKLKEEKAVLRVVCMYSFDCRKTSPASAAVLPLPFWTSFLLDCHAECWGCQYHCKRFTVPEGLTCWDKVGGSILFSSKCQYLLGVLAQASQCHLFLRTSEWLLCWVSFFVDSLAGLVVFLGKMKRIYYFTRTKENCPILMWGD